MLPPTIASILQDHVSLSLSCLDRLYRNGYVPTLQTSGQLCWFLREHLGYPLPSPALLAPLTERFVRAVQRFATEQGVPVVHFPRGQRTDDLVGVYRARGAVADGVVVIGGAQEKLRAFKAQQTVGASGGMQFRLSRQSAAVNHYYFYI